MGVSLPRTSRPSREPPPGHTAHHREAYGPTCEAIASRPSCRPPIPAGGRHHVDASPASSRRPTGADAFIAARPSHRLKLDRSDLEAVPTRVLATILAAAAAAAACPLEPT